jgi:hypothetical protein|tara:strand:+ start:1533 stop:2063 length:531 start_codon:yes stop_codon:yes gene_type:complete
MDELTRQILLERLQDPQWLAGILAPYSEPTPKGRTPRLPEEGEIQQPRVQERSRRNLFSSRPLYSGTNRIPRLSLGKNLDLTENLSLDTRGGVENFNRFIPQTYSGEAGLSYNNPKVGGRIGTNIRGSTLGGMPMQELLFNSYLNDVFGGALTGNVSHILGIPGSTRANLQYQKRF